MVKIVLLILSISLISCGVKSVKLQDNITKVPLKKDFFNKHYREKYKVIDLNGLDNNAIYIEYSYFSDYYNSVLNPNDRFNSFVYVIKFYENGCLNFFIMKDNNMPMLNPKIRGYRGISYVKKKDTLIDVIIPINESRKLGKKTYQVGFIGDTLVLKDIKKKTSYVYLKKSGKKKRVEYIPDW